MIKVNFDREMEKVINALSGERKKLLLHSCCAPCSSSCLERVKEFFDVTVYYCNPNLDSVEEFNKRANEQIRLCKELNVDCIIAPFIQDEFYSTVKGLETLPEGGERCFKCYKLRLDKTAEYAYKNGFDYFTTTLTLSPLKNADKLNEIGLESAEKYNVKFLPSDFKKQGGYLRSIELSKKYGLYRQDYCGCVYSKRHDLKIK